MTEFSSKFMGLSRKELSWKIWVKDLKSLQNYLYQIRIVFKWVIFSSKFKRV